MNEEQSALCNVAMRQANKEIKTAQLAARKPLRANAKTMREEIHERRRAAWREALRASKEFHSQAKQVGVACTTAIAESDAAILQQFEAKAAGQAEQNILGQVIAAADRLGA